MEAKRTFYQKIYRPLKQVLIDVSSIQDRSNETVWVEKIKPVKTVETHSLSLLTHNFLAIKTGKLQQVLYRFNLFDPN